MLGIALVAFFYFVEWFDRHRSERAGHYRIDEPIALPGPNRAAPPAFGTREGPISRLPVRGERRSPMPTPLPNPGRPS